MKLNFVKNCLTLCLLSAVVLSLGGCRKKVSQGSTSDTTAKDISAIVSEVTSELDNDSNESHNSPSGGSQAAKGDGAVSGKNESSAVSYTENSKEYSTKNDSSDFQSSSSVSSSTSNENTAEDTEIILPKVGYELDERLRVKAVSLSGNTVTLEIENTSKLWVPEDDTSVCYICKDKNGKQLKKEKITIGSIEWDNSKTYSFDIPTSAASVELSELNVNYWSVTA